MSIIYILYIYIFIIRQQTLQSLTVESVTPRGLGLFECKKFYVMCDWDPNY